ncbi:MAG TPA: hypothetical protein PLL66_03750 [Bacteroidales bacterium]|nr:hypothetical protein [Bacteroidales bacterium]
MKKTNILIIVAIAFICANAFYSCDKEEEPLNGITYPSSSTFGTNILSLSDSTNLASITDYSFSASLESEATLTIKITNLSETDSVGHVATWFYNAANVDNWDVSDYSSNSQTFNAKPSVDNDLNISFQSYYLGGTCRIDFYENSETITKTKYFVWE